jgi:hypothetical protein
MIFLKNHLLLQNIAVSIVHKQMLDIPAVQALEVEESNARKPFSYEDNLLELYEQ